MNKQEYGIVEVVEDIAKVGYSIIIFASKFFYKVSNIEALKNSMDAFALSRFSQRFEYFTHEHDKLSDDEKEAFYEDLKTNKQNINYLYEFVEKTRKSTFDIHAKIYAILSARLVKNKSLTYFENNLLTNMDILNFEDIKFIAINFNLIPINEFINNLANSKEKDLMTETLLTQKKLERSKRNFFIFEYSHYFTYMKCIQLGIFVDAPQDMKMSNFSDITDINKLEPIYKREILVSEYTLYFIELLKEINISNEL